MAYENFIEAMHENQSLVSAVITTHNRLELLKRAVKSVYDQTYTNIELIVVDDGSEDGTKEWCEKQDFEYINIEPGTGKGGNYARNLGIKKAKGQYIAFLDDDDYWIEEKIEKQVALIEERKCELVHCGRMLEVVEGDNINYIAVLPDNSSAGDLSKSILWSICTTTSCILVKKDALLSVGLFDEELRFWQEYELTIRLAQRAPFYFVDAPLVVYRVDEKDKDRLTNKFYEWRRSVDYLYHKHHGLYDSLGFRDRVKVSFLKWCDAKVRAKSSGLIREYYKNFIKCMCITTLVKLANLNIKKPWKKKLMTE